jgi:hypothetical protein
MIKTTLGTFLFAGLLITCVAFIIVLLLIKLLWAWTIPDLCPGAVEQGLVSATISWFTAAKVALFIAVLSGIAGGRRSRR